MRSSLRENAFPKERRLRKKRDFYFPAYKKFKTKYFNFVFSEQGRGRLGISISKKSLPLSVWRNRVKRLLRETFRQNHPSFAHFDVHVIGLPTLRGVVLQINRALVEDEFMAFSKKHPPKKGVSEWVC